MVVVVGRRLIPRLPTIPKRGRLEIAVDALLILGIVHAAAVIGPAHFRAGVVVIILVFLILPLCWFLAVGLIVPQIGFI